MERTYELKGWKDHMEFLELLARKGGRLLKGGEPDVDGVAKMVLNDFMRGKIPWFHPAPAIEGTEDGPLTEGREGRLGEMRIKRKRDEAESTVVASTAPSVATAGKEEDDFGGFSSDSDSEVEAEPKEVEVSSAEDMIPLGDSDEEVEEAEGSDSDGSDGEDESDIVIDGAEELIDSEDEEVPPVTKKRRKAK
jgi:nuclear GTP-binding protein